MRVTILLFTLAAAVVAAPPGKVSENSGTEAFGKNLGDNCLPLPTVQCNLDLRCLYDPSVLFYRCLWDQPDNTGRYREGQRCFPLKLQCADGFKCNFEIFEFRCRRYGP